MIARYAIGAVLALSLLAWLGGAVVVALVDPGTGVIPPPGGRVTDTGSLVRETLAGLLHEEPEKPCFIFGNGYADRFSVTIGDDEQTKVAVVRGPVDRRTGEIPLSLRYAVNRPGVLERVILRVSPEGISDLDDLNDPDAQDAWTTIGEAAIADAEGWCVAVIAESRAPSDSRHYMVQEFRVGGTGWSQTKNMPCAPTWLGRLHDRIAWWPIFRFVPKF